MSASHTSQLCRHLVSGCANCTRAHCLDFAVELLLNFGCRRVSQDPAAAKLVNVSRIRACHKRPARTHTHTHTRKQEGSAHAPQHRLRCVNRVRDFADVVFPQVLQHPAAHRLVHVLAPTGCQSDSCATSASARTARTEPLETDKVCAVSTCSPSPRRPIGAACHRAR